ncbi:hypothetical protein H6F71_02380 [Microcoleus sp. FACHB-61]|nr:hypothetical protein [Microcoleus sp. FACHB-61]
MVAHCEGRSAATDCVMDVTDVTDGCRGNEEEGKLLVWAGFPEIFSVMKKLKNPPFLLI